MNTTDTNTPISPPPSNSLDSWIDGQDVMTRLHISARTLQTWRSEGKIGYSKIGKKIYYKSSEIEKMLDKAYSISK